MSDPQDQPTADMLRQSTEALYETPVPDGPPPALVASTVEAMCSLDSPAEIPHNHERRKHMFRMIRYGSLAAVALVCLGVALFVVNQGATPAFADALRHFRESRTISFRITSKTEGMPTTIARQTMASPGYVRTQMRIGEKGRGISIWDLEKSAGITLIPLTKTAVKMTLADGLPDQAKSMFEFFDWLKTAPDHSEEDLGPKEVNGKACFGFRVQKGGQAWDIWIDQENGLPVRMESTLDLLGKTVTVVLDEFAFDKKLNPSLFSLTPPPGYTVTDELKAREPSERDVLVMFRKVTEANDGQFPADVEMKTLMKLMMALEKKEQRKKPGKMDLQRVHTMTLGLMFLNMNKERYTGRGVKLGDKERVVLWWTPQGRKTFRAVYGDLIVRDGDGKEPSSSK